MALDAYVLDQKSNNWKRKPLPNLNAKEKPPPPTTKYLVHDLDQSTEVLLNIILSIKIGFVFASPKV